MKKKTEAVQDRRGVSRRDFLSNTALVGAGLAIAPLLAGDTAGRMDKEQMKVVDR